jgi:hypothetical protein
VTGFTLVDERWLARTDGHWPTCPRLDRLTGAGVFEVDYTYGTGPPASGVLAVNKLACELLGSLTGGPCALPKRVTSITREGISMTLLDPFTFLDDGKLGVYEVDTFLAAVNPDGLRRPGRLILPWQRQAHRVR